MTDSHKQLLAWLVASVVGIAAAMAAMPSAFIDGHYIPVGNDSFYHARRILDLIADPSSLHQVDPLVHVPEGSTLIWPWGYDYFMSLLVRAGLALHVSADAMTAMDYIPTLAFPVGLLLLLSICRLLGASPLATFVALVAMAALPLNHDLYGIGSIDHHFAEQLFVLGSVAASLAWLSRPESLFRACLAGAIYGISVCIHNGLFIIQFPLVAAVFWAWVNGRAVPRNAFAFAMALVLATLLAAAPSTAFRERAFQFYTLSWFHVYFAACVGATIAFMSRRAFSKKSLLILIAGAMAALVPIVSQIVLADRFLSVNVEGAEQISEVQSLWQLAINRHSIRAVTDIYSPLVLLLPATVALCAYQVWKRREAREAFFWLACLAGTLLMAVMVRFHVYGSFAICLPWLVFIDERVKKTTASAVFVMVLVLACSSAPRSLFRTKVAAADPYYALTYDAYPDLARECEQSPGVALSNLDDANYIRFHTRCGVIANNFLLTAFHEKKVREARALLNTPAAELTRVAPQVRYVFVHRQSLFQLRPDGGMQFLPGGSPELPDPKLVSDLIDAPANALPPGFRVVKELAFEKPSHVVYARVLAIEPGKDPS